MIEGYVMWVNSLRGLIHQTKKPPKKSRRYLLSPFFTFDGKYIKEEDEALLFMGNSTVSDMLKSQINHDLDVLSTAKRFVVPDDFTVKPYVESIDEVDELFKKNPYAPFQSMFIQVPEWYFFLKKDEVMKNDKTTQVSHVLLLVEQLKKGLSIRISFLRTRDEFKDHHAIDFVPCTFLYGINQDDGINDDPPLVVHTYPGFKAEKTIDEVSGLALLVASTTLEIIDMINNHEVEYVNVSGRGVITKNTKLKRFSKIQHRIIKLSRPHYRSSTSTDGEHDPVHRRQHDVRGHWRHYKNGRQVWIKNHKRGDPTLGITDTEYDL